MKTGNKILIGGAVVVIAYLLWNKNKKRKSLTADNVASGSTSTAPANESTNLDLPKSMDLPNLTPSTNVPTEVAIKDSISVEPTPAIIERKPLPIEVALSESLILPIDKSSLIAEQKRLELEKLAQQERQAELERNLALERERLAEQKRLDDERIAMEERERIANQERIFLMEEEIRNRQNQAVVDRTGMYNQRFLDGVGNDYSRPLELVAI